MRVAVFLAIVIVIIAASASGDFTINKIFASSLFPFGETAQKTIKTKVETKKEIRKEEVKKEEIKKPQVKLKISNVYSGNSYNSSLITLKYESGKKETNITGYKIKTRQGEFTIPQGIEKYNSYMPEKDIFVGQHITVYLVGEKSPLARKNFRTNECFGYLERNYDFYPSVWSSCHSGPKLEELSDLQPYCQDFILRSYGCKAPNFQNNLKISIDSECVAYMEKNFNYNGCFNKYSNDSDFLKNYWYIYTGSNIVEPLHDTVYLYDRNNILLDKFSY